MTNTALSIFNKLRPVSVGFDSIFDHFENMWDDDFFNLPSVSNNYPPYNIVKSGNNKYDVEVALAGFNKKDINVNVGDGMLTIESKKEDKISDEDENGEVLHQGISKRYFKRSFSVADDVEVKGAKLENGLLRVSMERKIPEARKFKTIDVK